MEENTRQHCLNLGYFVAQNTTNSAYVSSTINYTTAERILLSLLTVAFCLVALIGNCSVIAVICKDDIIKRHKQNLYLLSMAVADASLVVLVVPFSLTNELLNHWPFGEFYCRIYLSIDILLCTASIWNICAIGLDRYFSVRYPLTFRAFRSKVRVRLGITIIWILSAIISLVPFMARLQAINLEMKCQLNNSSWYIVLSSMLSFYIPSTIMCPVYVNIYFIGRKLEKRKKEREVFRMSCKLKNKQPRLSKHAVEQHSNDCKQEFIERSKQDDTKEFHLKKNDQQKEKAFESEIDSANKSQEISKSTKKNLAGCSNSEKIDECENPKKRRSVKVCTYKDQIQTIKKIAICTTVPTFNENKNRRQSRRNDGNSSRKFSLRERRFLFIISLVMGCFMISWTPFFTTYMVYAICGKHCCINKSLFKIFFWIGYLNSVLNPILYTIFNKDLREAFKRLYRFKN